MVLEYSDIISFKTQLKQLRNEDHKPLWTNWLESTLTYLLLDSFNIPVLMKNLFLTTIYFVLFKILVTFFNTYENINVFL
jgi:hypothetical protein